MSKSSSLKVYEWLAIVALITAMGLLALMASLTKLSSPASIRLSHGHQFQGKIEVVVKGHVDKPGVYTVPSNTTMKAMLSLSELRPGADLRRLHMDRPIKRSRVINVKPRPMIRVHLKGAVKSPGTLFIPKGSTLEDLIVLSELTEKADLESLRKKRRLKPDETIIVPEEKCCGK